MKIAADCLVILRYKVTADDGQEIDEGKEPLSYVHGGYQDIFPKLEAALDGKQIGEQISVALAPQEAFGIYDPQLVIVAKTDEFEASPEIGMQIERAGSDVLYRVTDIDDEKVILDGNHPLAGLSLVFNATVQDVRPATAEEISRVARDVISAHIKPFRALKEGLLLLFGVPAFLIMVAGGMTGLLKDGIALDAVMILLLGIFLTSLWFGVHNLRDIFRRGEVLRLEKAGLFWRPHDQAVIPWENIAEVDRSSFNDEVTFTVTKDDKHFFMIDASTLSVEARAITESFRHYLPAEKLKGF